jgi:hypothetical protein
MLRKRWWVGALLGVPLLPYAWLFWLSMDRHGWKHDHLTALLLLWQTQTAAAFALLAAIIGAAALLHQTQEVQRREDARWHRERTTVAATLLAEISSILRGFEEDKAVEKYREVQQMMERYEAERAPLPPLPKNYNPTFSATVYEKCADRIGMLPTDEAVDVVRFYRFVNFYRNAVTRAYSDGLGTLDRINTLDGLNRMFPVELRRAKELQRKLEATAGRG